jgi:sugar lactone lactonase YvrE
VVEGSGRLDLLAGAPGGQGSVDGVGTNARFHTPHGMVLVGGDLFVAEMHNCTIRRVDIATGEVTTLAGRPEVHGSSDGQGSEARFYFPSGIASDRAGHLFVADTDNNILRTIDPTTGRVTTLAGAAMQFGSDDGTGADARFYLPAGIASDGAGHLFVADTFNQTIRQVVIATAAVTTLAGSPGETGSSDGIGPAARFVYPTDVASDGAGNLFIADQQGQTIRRLVIATGEVTTFAGSPGHPGTLDGDRLAARFDGLHGMLSDGAGLLFVADSENRTIRKIALDTGVVTLFAGSPGKIGSQDGTGPTAGFVFPYGLAGDADGHLFITDSDAIRKVVLASQEVTTLAGAAQNAGSDDGRATVARFDTPMGVASAGEDVLVADSANHTIRRIRLGTGDVTTLAGSPGEAGSQDGRGSSARFFRPTGVASDGAGHLLVADSENRTIRQVDLGSGQVTTLAGAPGAEGTQDGRGSQARFSRPSDVVTNHAGFAFVTDSDGHTVRKIDLGTGQVTTLAGLPGSFGNTDGIGSAARFDMPRGIAYAEPDDLFVADFGNSTIRKIAISTAQVTTLAGEAQQTGFADGIGPNALFAFPTGLASDGNNLFVADTGNHSIRKIDIRTRKVSLLVGAQDRAGLRLGPLPAGLSDPTGLALGPAGQLFISLAKENAILTAILP